MAPSPRRVAYVLTHHPLPSHTFIDREIAEIERRGVEVTVVSLNRPEDHEILDADDHATVDRTVYIKTGRVGLLLAAVRQLARRPRGVLHAVRLSMTTAGSDLGTLTKRLAHLVGALAVLDTCDREDAHHLHAHFGLAPASIVMLAAAVTEYDAEPTTYSLTIHGWHEFVDETIAALAVKVARASFVACISDFTRSQLMRIADHEHWDKLTIVRCGLDPDELEQPLAHRPVADPPVILCVARLSPEKGHLVLLDAVAALHGRGVPVRLRLIGHGGFEDAIRHHIAELGLDQHVTLLGARPTDVVLDELRHSDVFCLPSFAEGLPVSLMESMATGVPVVTTSIAGIPELVVDGVTGDIVPAGRADLVADRVERLVTDAAYRRRVIDAAAEAVRRQHSITTSGAILAQRFIETAGADSAGRDERRSTPTDLGQETP